MKFWHVSCIIKREKEGESTFVCNTSELCRTVEKAVANNAEILKNIQENESASVDGGMFELIHNENIYYKKYGFLVIINASETEIESIRKYILEEFGLKGERLERAIDKITCYIYVKRVCIGLISMLCR